ncbi:hypothetical protein QUF74_17525, partial [Candidatus Halobeggiatoa sp. HSG11]|nr:hypothetical protein [Candidatus Halobeggiatoa sp. HSG11]
ATFTAEDVALIPPEALSELQAVQIATMKGLEGLTIEQFAEIPVATLEGLTEYNMADLTIEVVNKFTPKHVDNLNHKSFKKMSSKRTSKMLVHFDSEQISLEQAKELLPDDWQLDMETGALTPPVGAKFTPPLLADKSSEQVSLPTIANIELGIGIGGLGDSIKTEMKHSLEEENLTDFVLSQEDSGILKIKGIDDEKGKQYAFIPDADDTIQVDTDEIPIGMAVGEGGFYTVTTPEGQQYKVIPAPKDPIALSSSLNNSEVTLGSSGDVLIKLSQNLRRDDRFVLMFDPFVEPAPESWCIFDDVTGESMCDFDNAPENIRPGIHINNTRRADLNLPIGKMVYADGSSQNISPTVYSPETFIKEALKFKGVEKVIFNMNGTFYVLHEGREYIVMPSFNVQTDSKVSVTKIELNEQGGVSYSVPVELPNKTRRDNRIMLMFDLFIEQAPESWCVDNDGAIFCDFDNVPDYR